MPHNHERDRVARGTRDKAYERKYLQLKIMCQFVSFPLAQILFGCHFPVRRGLVSRFSVSLACPQVVWNDNTPTYLTAYKQVPGSLSLSLLGSSLLPFLGRGPRRKKENKGRGVDLWREVVWVMANGINLLLSFYGNDAVMTPATDCKAKDNP